MIIEASEREGSRIISDDFPKAISRIKQVQFYHDKIMVELVNTQIAAMQTILLMDACIIGEDAICLGMNLTEQYLDKLITYDENKGLITIPFPAPKSIIFLDIEGLGQKSF